MSKTKFLILPNNKKGQAAIEFIFIILIIMVYIFTTSKPFIVNAQGTIEDIQNITKINYEAQKITDTITQVSLLGVGSKNTITIIIPSNTTLHCDDTYNTISFKTNINVNKNNPQVGVCGADNICEKTFKIREGITIYCNFMEKITGVHEIKIEKVNETKVGVYEQI